MDWNQIVEKVTPYIVKINTPEGHGTGFLCVYNEDHSMCGIATAHHVVAHADEWQHPLRITNLSTEKTYFAKESERVILLDADRDSAVILLFQAHLQFPEILIPLLPADRILPIGVEVGWLGFPNIDPQTMCFFSGNVSARKPSAYLIDGVAINGVSGGPVLYSTATEGIQIVGSISAYMPNRASTGVLPGLCVAQDVSHFNTTARYIKSADDAKRKKLEEAQQDRPTTAISEFSGPA